MQVALIYARAENRCIGKDGQLPWHLPDDMAFFRETTIGHPVIMGRRTWEERKRPLPDRLNVVVTRNRDYEVDPGVMRATSLETALDLVSAHDSIAYIVGGVALYQAAMPMASTVYETLVHAEIEGDTFIPAFNYAAEDGWDSQRLFVHEVDQSHAYAFSVFKHTRHSIRK